MALPSSVHPAISNIIRRALTFSPEGRASSAAEMRDAIERAMASAGLTTTSNDVAAFAAAHLADRAEKRKFAIDSALAAAAERKRVDELFDPVLGRDARPRRASTMPPPPSSNPSVSSGTYPDTPEALIPPIELVARLTPRISDPAPQPSSYATLGSAAIEATQTHGQAPRSYKGLFAAVTVLVAAVALAAGVRLDLLHPELPGKMLSAPPPSTFKPPVAPPVPQPQAPPPPAAPASTTPGSSFSLLPTVAATALPKAGASPTSPAAQDPAQHPRPAPAPAPAKGSPRKAAPAPEPEPEPAAAPEPAPAPPPPTPPPPPPAPTGRQKNAGVDDGF